MIQAAQSRGVPLISARQLLEWLDGRGASHFSNLAWTAATGVLSFTVAVDTRARGLQALLPFHAGGDLQSLVGPDSTPVAFTSRAIKGIRYAAFSAAQGAWTATYLRDTAAPTVVAHTPVAATDVPVSAVVSATFSSAVQLNSLGFTLRTAAGLVSTSVALDASLITATLTLLPAGSQLAYDTSYTATVSSALNQAGTAQLAGNVSWTFRTSALVLPCSPGSPPIVCENSLAGSPPSVWDIVGSGDSSIQGFATDISTAVGGTVRFKILTPSADYRLDIYRLGFYGGAGARLIAGGIAPHGPLPQSQPACLSDAATGLVDCGNWAESASWTIPAGTVSGVFFALLTRADGGGGRSHIPFVVRDDSRAAAILFQTSDTTWHAFNQYGGNSLYAGSPAGRAYKVRRATTHTHRHAHRDSRAADQPSAAR